MSSVNFDETLDSLSSPQEKEHLYRLLLLIRKEVEWPERDNIVKLREKGCLKHLINYLEQQNSNLNVVNVILSILGNCCMDRISAGEIVSLFLF